MTPPKFHRLALLFPAIDAGERDRLKSDIEKHGVRQPVLVWNGQIVDGRHRAEIASELGISYQTRELHCDESDLPALVWSYNATRRHLSSSQRAAIAAQLGIVESFYTNSGRSTPGDGSGRAIDKAAKVAGTSKTMLQRALRVRDRNGDLLSKVVEGSVSLNTALIACDPATEANRAQSGTVSPTLNDAAPSFDGLDLPVPMQLETVFESRSKFKEAAGLLRRLRHLIDDISEHPGGEYLNRGRQGLIAQLKSVGTELKQSKPYTSTPKEAKHDLPWITKRIFDGMPEDMRDRHIARSARGNSASSIPLAREVSS